MPARKTPQPVPLSAHSFRTVMMHMKMQITAFLARRPHRSFQLTRQRDYRRTLAMPGYWKFTLEVSRMLWRHKKLFGLLALLYMVLYVLLVGIVSQDTYQQLSSTVGDISSGNLGTFAQGAALYVTVLTSGMSGALDASKQTYAGLLGLLLWLTVVWLLRAVIAGKAPKLRDGLYNAGSPIVATLLVAIIMVLQALPVGLASVAYGAATASGMLDGGVEAMLFWMVFALLVALSLYWMTSTFIALVIITLPGMYPAKALRAAGDLVLGRRLRILWRILWLFLVLLISWTVVVLPVILFDAWIKSVWSLVRNIPLVPVTLLVMTSVSLVFAAAYVYLLYRRIVDDDTRAGQN